MQQNDLIQALAAALKPHMSSGPVAKATGVPITTYAYSEGGLFGSCKNDPVLINAMVGPMGYEARLQWFGTDTENPIVESLTSIFSTGYDQATVCADCGTPQIKRCATTSCFGRICQQTDEMVIDEIGLKANRNVPVLAFFGNVTAPDGSVIIPQGTRVTDMFMLNVMAVAYNLRRQIGVDMWNGNPAANTAGHWFMTGFDLLINTGHMDALTGNFCTGLDSVIANYGNAIVGAAGSPSVVAQVAGLVRSIRYRIDTAGFNSDAAAIDIVMHPTLWDCVADAWACEYGLTCQSWTAAGLREMINDGLSTAELRDKFVSTRTLRIDGRDYPVTLDNGIPVVNRSIGNQNARCSTIYVITRELAGAPNGGVITYGEYQDFNATAGDTINWFQRTFDSKQIAVTDGGRFVVAPTTAGGFCFDVRELVKPRIRMLMPQLAGRLTNVCCVPIGTYPDVSGSGGLYEVGCGAYDSPPNYLYGDCWPLHTGWGSGR